MKVEKHILVTVTLAKHIYQLKVADDKIVCHRCIGSWDWTTVPIGSEWLQSKLEEAADAKFINFSDHFPTN
jgi:hypothetical protein